MTATLARVRATLRAAPNAAIRAGLVTANAASRVEMPTPRRPRPVVWTAARVAEWQRTGIRPPVAVWTPARTARFLNAIRGHRLYAAYHLIALRGLRRGAASLALAAKVDLKIVRDLLGHSSIVLTADTYTSVLPDVARKAAEDAASLIIAAGCLVPGTTRHRKPEPPDRGGGGQGSGSRATRDARSAAQHGRTWIST